MWNVSYFSVIRRFLVFIQSTKLTSIDLRNNNLGEIAAKYLSNALMQNKTLTKILLRINNFGDNGVKYIS